ncbi:hypothetical protein B0H15DRAFT_956970 [Mycena belliarum]|uniref:Uncharacterized protein n=1 Tax=Mycena belliarum TaxID=1033014 RepID=A0AAD6TR26_9AGAR|nr:hypothetical protein B0H15DRAFT_956970 [Mycena belliae]
MAGRRTLRSGKEFSSYDLAIARAIPPPVHFDVAQRIKQTLLDEGGTDCLDEHESVAGPGDPAPVSNHSPVIPVSPATGSLPASQSLSAKARNQLKSRARRDRKRESERARSGDPKIKAVHRKRLAEGKAAALLLPIDIATFSHSKPAWIGARDASPADTTPPAAPEGDTGLGGVIYTQDEVDALVGMPGFRYIPWLGRLAIPLLDSERRIIGVLGGTPRDFAGWKVVTDGAAALLEERLPRIRLSEERLHHRRAPADEPFPAIARGLSHGGGQVEPGELCNNVANTELTDELLAHPNFCRLASFANSLFAMWAPLLFAFYKAQMALFAAWNPRLRWNFVGSIFAACTFNFGRAVTVPHVDFANLAWGWCCITALGAFNPDYGGHLILWDLRLVVRFPPGSTVLIPSALVKHSNTPVAPHERRSSFTQYTAGGIFRWIRNGFQTDDAFAATASEEERDARKREDLTRWATGVQMFSTIDDI